MPAVAGILGQVHGVRAGHTPAPDKGTRASDERRGHGGDPLWGRGYRGGGGGATVPAGRAASGGRGSSRKCPATSLPWSPIHSWPLVSNGHSAGSVTSLGRGGYRLPSRHTTL